MALAQPSQNVLADGLSPALQHALQHVAGVCTRAETRQQHGVLELLHGCAPELLPEQQLSAAALARRELLARELLHAQVLARLHERMVEAGLCGVLIKGEALARTLYPCAAVRPRHDIDLWVAPADRGPLEVLLRDLGARPQLAACGQWIQPEQLWRVPFGQAAIGIDLHWQFCSRPALLPALPLADVLERSTAWQLTESSTFGLRLPVLCDALLLACIHRRAHHRDGERWIWLLDIALLWEQLDAKNREALVAQAVHGAVAALLADALRRVIVLLSTPPDPALLARLDEAARSEPARHLLAAPQQYSDLRFDVRYASGRRLAVLRDYLFPPAAYMRTRYADRSVQWLPWLYLRRLLRRLP